jgi:non-heme chloroperoxidase
MKFIKFQDKLTGEEISLSYFDYGSGKPVIFIHGWPISKEMWEYQLEPLVNAGFRCISYDRRGFGKSSKPWNGYDFDTLSDDLRELIVALDLHGATLVSFSMGAGEIARYMTRHNGERVSKIALISSVLPFMLKTEDNEFGFDEAMFQGMAEGMRNDRIAVIEGVLKMDNSTSHAMSDALLNHFLNTGAEASGRACTETSWHFSHTDFRKELPQIKVPVMLVHGDADNVVPKSASSDQTAKLIPHAIYKVYEQAPHCLFYSHRKQLNADLISFING